MMYDKWWRSNSKLDMCAPPSDKAKSSKANALNVDNIGGVFVVLLCGIAFSVLVAILEFYYNSREIDENDTCDPFFYFNKSPSSPGRQSLCSEMTQELCYALQCYGPRHRPTLKRQCLICTQNEYDLGDGNSGKLSSVFGYTGNRADTCAGNLTSDLGVCIDNTHFADFQRHFCNFQVPRHFTEGPARERPRASITDISLSSISDFA